MRTSLILAIVFFFSVLDQLPEGPIFIVMCFLVRIVDAIGFGAAITASSSILAKAFPNNVATVLVCNLIFFLTFLFMWPKHLFDLFLRAFPHSLVDFPPFILTSIS